MSQALSDYFVREAGEYLAELERRIATEPLPDAERVFRLSRGIRGSAQVAQADGVAEVAARLEGAARFVLEGRIPWSEDLRARVERTVEDLRHLLDRGAAWGDEEEARVQSAIARWGGFADIARSPAPVTTGEAVFTFVRTELAGILVALDRTITVLEDQPPDRHSLDGLMRRIRTLRGVSGSDLLAPVLEVVEGCDELLRALVTGQIPEEDPSVILAATRSALHTAAGALDRGEAPPAHGPALNRFRALRSRLFVDPERFADPSVVSIRTLFYDDDGLTVVASPVAPVSQPLGTPATPEIEAFFRAEAAGMLDSSEGLLAGAEMNGQGDVSAVVRRLADLTGALAELAETYRLGHAAATIRTAESELRSTSAIPEARSILGGLRAELIPGSKAAPARPVPGGGAADMEPHEAIATHTELSAGAGVVPIEDLLLRGPAALAAALALRPRFQQKLDEAARADPVLHELLSELWDLVELAGERGSVE
jgi:HPt (histidine-containing phosphotransfer) domain-containing protein